MPTEGVFSESVWNGDVFHCKQVGKGFKCTCLERDSCLSRKKVVSELNLERGYHYVNCRNCCAPAHID